MRLEYGAVYKDLLEEPVITLSKLPPTVRPTELLDFTPSGGLQRAAAASRSGRNCERIIESS